ncbi:MAG: beta-propeller fold lactonase family protein [Planctomycetota bacterium]
MTLTTAALCATLLLFNVACSRVGTGGPAPSSGPARHLVVATQDGHVRALALTDGRIGAATTDVDLGEGARFLARHPTLPIVYALGDASLFALAWDGAAGTLSLLGKGAVGGRGTHVTVHPSGTCALVASYGEHSVSTIPLGPDGKPGDVADTLGKSEAGPLRRAHQARVHAATGTVHVPCLGEDYVAVLHVSGDGRKLTLAGTASTPAGAGPRHMDYAPAAPYAYVLNEVASSITQLRVDPSSGALVPVTTVTTLPKGFNEATGRSSDIHVAPNGRHLFAVNREPLNDIVTFGIAEDGGLTEVARADTGGVHARTFAVDPTGSYLWLGNTKSKSVTTFLVRPNGALERLGAAWDAPAEVACVLAL